jgi:hypothetical protein
MNKKELLEKLADEQEYIFVIYNYEIIKTTINGIFHHTNDDIFWYNTEYGSFTEDDIFVSYELARNWLKEKCEEILKKIIRGQI